MGQVLSPISWTAASNDIGLALDRTYSIKHPRITTLRVHPTGDFFVAGNEEGSLLLFDLSTEADSPRHCSTLSYEYGGVSEICWLGADVLAVGTTRGKIVTFSIGNNDNRRFVELMNVKAHGDGAAQIAVDGLDYCPTSHRLVSVAEGVGSIRLWNVADAGALVAQELPIATTAYNTPRYASFIRGGTQLLVAFMEKSMVQIFSIDPFELTLERFIGREAGYHDGHLGSALVLETMERLLVLNWRFGFLMYDFQSVASNNPPSMPLVCRSGNNAFCNQGLASMRSGSCVASVLDKGVIQLWKAREGTSAGFLKIAGRDRHISAIHAVSGIRDTLVAASTREDDGPTLLTVWRNEIPLGLPLVQAEEFLGAQRTINYQAGLTLHPVSYIMPPAPTASTTGTNPYPAIPIIATTTITVTPSTPTTTISVAPTTTATIVASPPSPLTSTVASESDVVTEVPPLYLLSEPLRKVETTQTVFPLLYTVNNARVA